MSKSRLKLDGKKFGKLTVLNFYDIEKGRNSRWLCKCECGNETVVRGYALKGGHTNSCGCSKNAKTNPNGISKHKLYATWFSMLSRCENPHHKSYEGYGGRGIKICEQWHNPETFYKWCESNGHKKGLVLDRTDNNGGYEPGNCRFVTKSQNARNTRTNINVEYMGETKTLTGWAEKLSLSYAALRNRYHKGERGEKLFRPVGK